MDIRKEMLEAGVIKENDTAVERKFVEFSYSSQEDFARFEAVKQANAIIAEAIRRTGGNMTKELIDAYEGLDKVMEHIKSVELDVIKVGR